MASVALDRRVSGTPGAIVSRRDAGTPAALVSRRVIGSPGAASDREGRNARIVRHIGVAPLPEADNSRVMFANITTKQFTVEQYANPDRSIIWANQPLVVPPPTNFFTSYYVPAMRDPNTAHDLEWFQENHPDWLTYGADQVTPLQSRPSDNVWEIDITSPEPRAYMLGLMLDQISNGFLSIALDNVAITNGTLWKGHYVGSTPKAGPGDVGWAPNTNGGVWTPQFAGVQYEAAFEAAIEDYLLYLQSSLNSVGGALFINGKIYKNQIPAVIRMTDCSDIWLWEGGHTRADSLGNYLIVDGLWESFYQVVRSNTTQRAAVIYNEFATHGANSATPAEIAWIVANFLLVKEERTYLALQGHGDLSGSHYNFPDTFQPNVGAPISDPAHVLNAWIRNYENGACVVNPLSNDTASYVVPSGTWADQFGNVIPVGTNTLAAKSGVTIVNRGTFGDCEPFDLSESGTTTDFSGVLFNGSTDYYVRSTDLTDAIDEPGGTFSCWVKFVDAGGDGVAQSIFRNNSGSLGFTKRTDNKLSFFLRNEAATITFSKITTGTYLAGGGWHHLLFSWDTNHASGAKIGQLYIDDVAVAVTTADAGAAFDVNTSDASWAYGASPAGGNPLFGAIAELWYAEGPQIDLSVTANRRKFITTGLAAQSLGAFGETPTGSSPSIYIHGPVAVFGNNFGTGGDFAKHGAPTAAAGPSHV